MFPRRLQDAFKTPPSVLGGFLGLPSTSTQKGCHALILSFSGLSRDYVGRFLSPNMLFGGSRGFLGFVLESLGSFLGAMSVSFPPLLSSQADFPSSDDLPLSSSAALLLSYSHAPMLPCSHGFLRSCSHAPRLSCFHALVFSCSHAPMLSGS